MRPSAIKTLDDSLSKESLVTAIIDEIRLLEQKDPNSELIFGTRSISYKSYISALRDIANKRSTLTDSAFQKWLRDNFEFLEVYGERSWGDVLITGYFEPIINGSKKRTAKYSRPLYRAPSDLLRLNLKDFDPNSTLNRELRARINGRNIVPYYSRREIDTDQKLAEKKLEICWVDPIDAFFMSIQGSGRVKLPNGKILRLIYSDKNGHQYSSIGNFLRDKVAPQPVTLFSIESYLRTLKLSDLDDILNKNPSYVFFKESETPALTYLGTSAVAGRTIATDNRFFPKGALAYLEFNEGNRFVLDQDIGGAIKGGGRVDLFTGSGESGRALAGALNTRGKLYYLFPKFP